MHAENKCCSLSHDLYFIGNFFFRTTVRGQIYVLDYPTFDYSHLHNRNLRCLILIDFVLHRNDTVLNIKSFDPDVFVKYT